MSKRRRASELMFKRSHGFGVNAKIPIVAVLSGTGTVAAAGVITVVASNTSTQCYITVTSGTNIGTLIGTQNSAGAPI
jgi:hypothetical protein